MGTNGIINTIAGNGQGDYSGDGGPATQAGIEFSTGIAVGPDSSVYISSYDRVRRVSPDGIITTVAGNGVSGYSGDGGPATQAQIDTESIAVGPDGGLYIADSYNDRIRLVGTDGVITTIAGSDTRGFRGDGGPATQARVDFPSGVAVSPDESIYIADSSNNRIRRIASPVPGLKTTGFAVSSKDVLELYQFNSQGQHLNTVNTLTGALRFQFTYNDQGVLTGVTDGDGNQTIIERDATGTPTAIVSPDDQRTTLTLDTNGYLALLNNPAGVATRMTYTPEGLLTSFTNGNGHTSLLQYDELGRLTQDTDAAGGFSALARTEFDNGYLASLTSALNRLTTYRVEELTTGDRKRTNTAPDDTITETLSKTDGSTITTAPDGTVTTDVQGPDPRFGMQAPLSSKVSIRTPSGLTATATRTRSVTLTTANDPLSLLTQTDTTTLKETLHRYLLK